MIDATHDGESVNIVSYAANLHAHAVFLVALISSCAVEAGNCLTIQAGRKAPPCPCDLCVPSKLQQLDSVQQSLQTSNTNQLLQEHHSLQFISLLLFIRSQIDWQVQLGRNRSYYWLAFWKKLAMRLTDYMLSALTTQPASHKAAGIRPPFPMQAAWWAKAQGGLKLAYCFAGDDTWVIVASDGLFENEIRGGGGGLENQQVVDMCLKAKNGTSAKQLARELIEAAQAEGTTDDVTVALLKLSV